MIKKRLVGLFAHAKKHIVQNVFWQWIALLVQITLVFSIADLLEHIIKAEESTAPIQRTIIVLAGAMAVRFLCDRMAAKASYAASVDVKQILRERIYEKLLRLGPSYREQTTTSEVVQLSTEGVEQLEIYFGKYLPQLLYSLLAPVTLFAVLAFVSLKASVVLLICVPLIPVSIVAIQRFAKKLLHKYWGIYTELGDSFLENLQGLTTLKIYQSDEKKAREMDEEAQRFRKITMKVLTMQLNSTSVMDIVAYGGAAAGMIVAGTEFLSGSLSFGGALVIILLASEFFIPLRLLGSFFHIAMNGMSASDKIFTLLDIETAVSGELDLAAESLDIRLSQVHFSYEKEREILKDIDLYVSAGSFVSLVGESGCGKSTIAGILTGKNRTFAGDVLLGGKPILQIKEWELMKHVTLVRHDSYLFKGTVEENLKMAKPDASKEEMEKALRQVNLLSFLEEHQGIQTQILERGSNFSGGQCQRLVLARALLHDTPVYIFDEATSNIDADSEEMIMQVIHELAKTKSVLLISHRLSNVTASDTIYMLVDGEIREKGTHKELMQKNGCYRHLYERQQQLECYSRKVFPGNREAVSL